MTGAAEFAQTIIDRLNQRGFLTQDDILGLENTLKKITEILIRKDIAKVSEVR